MANTLAGDITEQLTAAGFPVVSVIIGTPTDRTTWRVQLDDAATPAQIAAAAAFLTTYDLAGLPARLVDADLNGQIDEKRLRAVVQGLWEAIPAPTLTKVQLRARILAILRGL